MNALIGQSQTNSELVGFVYPEIRNHQPVFLGHIGQIGDMVRINQVDELIFCASSISSQQIINTMLHFTDSGITFKIAPPESLSVIGSNSAGNAGDLYTLHFNTLSRVLSQRKKRLFDMVFSLILLGISPLTVFFIRDPAGMFRNILRVLSGFSSWVGYCRLSNHQRAELLARILKERREKWEADQRVKGKDPGKLKYPEPVGPDTSDLSELPKGWVWATFDQLLQTH